MESDSNETMYGNSNINMGFVDSGNTNIGGNTGTMSSNISPPPTHQQQQQQQQQQSSSPVGSVGIGGLSFSLGSNGISLEPSSISHRVNSITSKIKEFKQERMETTRDWRSFVGSRQQYGLPNMKDTTSRIKENVVYFQSNYLILFLCFSVFFIITNPFYLLLLGLLLFISVYIHNSTSLTDIQRKIAYGIQAFLSIYFLLYAGSSIFWLVGATCCITLLHASFHAPNSTDETNIKFGDGV
ncbi:hypothetical protein RB653_004411 [Dictyostelium firmibasis]|uniref:PRA1 family protein n=1 Tax=Dictyostelium firmibasis TaxID=79012 RepID=A0AAN7U9N7_9MYCE